MPMQEQREARESSVFHENKDWITEAEYGRLRSQGCVKELSVSNNLSFFSQTSQLVIFFTVFTLLDVIDEKLTLATRISRDTCLEDGRILVSLSVIQSR